MDSSLLETVKKAYRLQIASAEPVGSVYKKVAIYKLQTSAGTKAVKEFHFSEEELRFVTAVQLFLYKAGANVVRPIRTRDRELYLKCGKRLFYLTDWFEGRAFDSQLLDDVDKVSKSIAVMHTLARNFRFRPVPHRRRFQFKPLVQIERRHQNFIERIKQIKIDNSMGRELAANASLFIEQGERAIQGMKELQQQSFAEQGKENEQRQLVHRDLTCPNLLVGESGSCILDFDLCSYGSCSMDLAAYMANTLGWSIPAGTRALQSYLAVRPLSKSNRRMTLYQMLLPREAWELERVHGLQVLRKEKQAMELTEQRFQVLLNSQSLKEKFVSHFAELSDNL